MEEAYQDFKELIESEKYKGYKSTDDQQSMLTDFTCISAIRVAAKNTKGDVGTYQKTISTFAKLINEQRKHQNVVKNSKETEALMKGLQNSAESKLLQSIIRSGTTSTTTDNKQSSFKFVQGMKVDQDQLLLNSDKYTSYKENIFSNDDFLLYRGIVQFYCKKYQQAKVDFEESVRIKKEYKSLSILKESDDQSENMSIDTDLSDVGLCALNVNEFAYNIVLCNIMVRYYHNIMDRWEIWRKRLRIVQE